MGVSGHILGERKLRQLNRATEMMFDRAYNRDGVGEARMQFPQGCEHYRVDFSTWEIQRITNPTHWASCNTRWGLTNDG